MLKRCVGLLFSATGLLCFIVGSSTLRVAAELISSTQPAVGERVPSEDAVLKDFHSMGLINGQLNIFRCACPVRDIAKTISTTEPTQAQFNNAKDRMQRLYDLGVRTVISFQGSPAPGDDGNHADGAAVSLERAAASAVGIELISQPIANSGPGSLQTMTDQQVLDLIDPISSEIFQHARKGGVVFHCSAGHDRTGLMAAYLRLKYQHWDVEQAIDEMRRYGHNWPKYSSNGGISSWHEQHLRGIVALMKTQSQAP